MNRRAAALATLALAVAWSLGAQSIFTIAGGFSSEGRPAIVVGLNQPEGLAFDADGNLYLSEGFADRVRKVDLTTGAITSVAGDGTSGFRGDGGPATEAALDSPGDVAIDSRGNLYIAIRIGSRVRKVDLETGIITTVAGTGLPFYSGDGGPAVNAGLYYPTGVVTDSHDDVYISDSWDHRIRKIDVSTGIITTVAGTGAEGFSGDGGPATLAQLNEPTRLAVDSEDNLFIADSNNYRIRKVSFASGIITTVAGNGGNGYSGDGGQATQAQMKSPEGVRVDVEGNVYLTDRYNHRVRKVDAATGVIHTIAGNGTRGFSGDGGNAVAAQLFFPHGIEVDPIGNVYFSDYANRRVRRIDATTNLITTVAGNGQTALTGDGGPATVAELSSPKGVAVDSSGNIHIADYQSDRIRRVNAESGIIDTYAGTGESDSDGDGGPATEAAVQTPSDVAFDDSDNLYFVETFGFKVRRIDGISGIVTTVAGDGNGRLSGDGGPATRASLMYPSNLAVDRDGNVYINDYWNHKIRKVSASTGRIETFAGNGVGAGDEYHGSFSGDAGPALAAGLNSPEGLATDDEGNLYIADKYNNRIRKVDVMTNVITTVVGSGPTGTGTGRTSGDGGPATLATLHEALDVGFDRGGNMYVVELTRIRRVDRQTGFITTVAGSGEANFTGDGGAATVAGIRFPNSIAVDANGNFFFSDSSSRVRAVFACRDVMDTTLISPANGSSGLTVSPRLEWNDVEGAFRYDLYLGLTASLTTPLARDLETTTFSPVNLQPLTTYYWKIVAKGDPFCDPFRSAETGVWSFTTTSDCGPPDFETAGD